MQRVACGRTRSIVVRGGNGSDVGARPNPGARGTTSVRDLLQLPLVQNGLPQLVAGESGLDQAVRWAHVLDVADVEGLLAGGELVLTTGLGLGADRRRQTEFVRELVHVGASGILLELGTTYRQRVPDALREAAESGGLPLVALGRRTRFVDLSEAINSAVLSRQFAELRRGDAIQGQLTDLVLRGDDLPALLAEVARVIGNPVVLEDAGGQLIQTATHDANDEAVLAAWEDLRRVEARGEQATGALSADVHVMGTTWGRLIGFQLDRTLEELDAEAVRRGAVAVALNILGQRHDEYVRIQSRGAFLEAVRQGRIRDAQRRATALGLPRGAGNLVPIAATWRSQRWAEAGHSPSLAWARVLADLRRALARESWETLLGAEHDQLLGVVATRTRTPDDALLDGIASALHSGLERWQLGPADVALAIADPQTDWSEIGTALRKASRGAEAAAADEPRAWHDARRLTIVDLLVAMRDVPELHAFVAEVLGPLTDRETARTRQMMETLEAYIAHDGRKADTARALNLERQSLYYRLERIESLLRVRLDDPDDLLAVHLALRAWRLLHLSRPV